METLDAQIEAVLFAKGEPETIQSLAKMLSKSEAEVQEGIQILSGKFSGRGIVLVQNEQTVELRTAPEHGALIEKLRKEELTKDLGKAGAETLAIILYKGPITRAEVDYIRGVNSTFIIRNLLIRGLVEKVPNPKDQRSYLYKPTTDLLSYLGVSKLEDLPEYEKVKEEFALFEKTPEEEHVES